jgi:hypothetical protein
MLRRPSLARFGALVLPFIGATALTTACSSSSYSAGTEDSGSDATQSDGGVDAAQDSGTNHDATTDSAAQDAASDTTTAPDAAENSATTDAARDTSTADVIADTATADSANDTDTKDSGCSATTPVALTVYNFRAWCNVSIAGTAIATPPLGTTEAQTMCVASGADLSVEPVSATFELGANPFLTGTSAVTDTAGAASTTLAPGATCVFICCPFATGGGCTGQTNPCPAPVDGI